MTQSTTRGTWNNKADFVLALISYGVGLGNVWRFPYLAYSSGGGAFLIPFLVSSVVVGIPYALLEVSLGQWMKEGGIGAWNLTPLFKGIGFANLIIVFFGNVYYEVILAWSLRYLYDSFSFDLPWKYCSNKWNTECCSESLLYGNQTSALTTSTSSSLTVENSTSSAVTPSPNCTKIIDPITEYWERNVLGISKGIEDIGSMKWDLFVALLVAWLIVYFSIFRGMKNSQVVVYITAIMPYVFLFILLIRGLMLPGAVDGIIYYIRPDWNKLFMFQVWSDAGTQVFYSYGIGIAALVALGSYNKFHHNSYRDVIIFTVTNSFTSILSGFVIFSVLGYMSHIQGVDISNVAEEGPGLAFIVYPQALALMPFSPIWSIMFFIMLFLLGLGTQIVAAEAITTALMDEYLPKITLMANFKYVKELLSGINVLISFACGLPMITNGGMYIFQIFDYYAASRTLLFVGLFECVAIAYFYGIGQYCKNLEKMWRMRLGPWLRFMWVFATPFFTLVLIVFTVMTYEDLTYNRTYKYPTWALSIGWLLSVSSFICIPLYAFYKFITTSGSIGTRFKKLKVVRLKSHQLGIDQFDELNQGDTSTLNGNRSLVNSGSILTTNAIGESRNLITSVDKKNSDEDMSTMGTSSKEINEIGSKKNHHRMNKSSSTSDDETIAEFANSRTFIKS